MDGERERNARPDQTTRVGRYRILERIGQGATAAVYRASDDEAGRDVALKLLLTDLEGESEIRTRFLREVEIARVLRHRNLVTVYEAGEVDGRFFLAMELLDGVTLREHLAHHPSLDLEDKLDLMMQLCEGLAVAHDHGIYHRDLKPSNLFVRHDGALKILDFGIARLASSSMTVAGLLMGTPDFMSPEQARGAEIDHRSDIFSAGAVLYFLLSGRKPFPGAQLPNVLHKVEHEEPEPLAEAEAPAGLGRIVSKTLAKKPAGRHADIRSLLRDLVEFRRDYAKDTRRLAHRMREQAEQARQIDERCRTLAGTLELSGPEWTTRDAFSATGLSVRHPVVAERGPAVLTWMPLRRAVANDMADSLATFVAERKAMVGRLTGAAESLQAAVQAVSAGEPLRAIEHAERVLASLPAAAAARRIVDTAREDSSARDAAARQRRAGEALAQARRALAQAEWTSAEGHLARARDLDPQASDLAAVRQELQTRRAAADEAKRDDDRRQQASLAASERAARATRLAAHVERARAALAAGRFDEARAEAHHALAIDAGNAAARQVVVEAAEREVSARRARGASRLAARSVKTGRVFGAQAERALLLGDLERARGIAETALAIDPENREARAVLARTQPVIEELGDGGAPIDRSSDPEATQILVLSDVWSRWRGRLAGRSSSRAGTARSGAAPLLPLDACRLRIARHSGAPRHLDLTPRRYRVGRARDNEIVLDDPSHTVSRLHAELQPEAGGYVLVDRNSDNGLWVDGARVDRVLLEPNVPVVIGPYRLVIEGTASHGDPSPSPRAGGVRP